jgi:hypothetical protein
MFQRELGASTLIDGRNRIDPQKRLTPSDVLKGKDMRNFTYLTHTNPKSKTYFENVEKRHNVRRPVKREFFLNPYHNFANFDRGIQRPPMENRVVKAKDQTPVDRQILQEFRNMAMDTNIELDRTLGMETLEQGSALEQLRTLREQIRRGLPSNISRELQNTLLNTITDNFMRQNVPFRQRNPATGTEIRDPLRDAISRARDGRHSVDTRLSNATFNETILPQNNPFRPEQPLPSRSELIFPDEKLFQNRNLIEGKVLRVQNVRDLARQVVRDIMPLDGYSQFVSKQKRSVREQRLKGLQQGDDIEMTDIGTLIGPGRPRKSKPTFVIEGTDEELPPAAAAAGQQRRRRRQRQRQYTGQAGAEERKDND